MLSIKKIKEFKEYYFKSDNQQKKSKNKDLFML
jgi:hypothetical protein